MFTFESKILIIISSWVNLFNLYWLVQKNYLSSAGKYNNDNATDNINTLHGQL